MKGQFVMRSVVIASCALVLSAAQGFAQAPAAQPKPAPAPAAAPAPAPVPAPPAVFPQGGKIGIVNLQQIAQLSADGKTSTARVQTLIAKKQTEAAAKSKTLQDNQNKLKQSGALMNDAARSQLEKDIERQTLEEQRFQQDAQAEINELQTELQSDFQKKLFPVLIELAQEKGLHVLVSQADAGVIWWEPGVDLTLEAIKRFDALAPKTAAAPAPKPPTAAAPAAKP
jgi:Skp family chaperone for outer membrane proteins